MTGRRSTSWILLAPSLIGIVCFLILPIVLVAWLSLHSWNLLGPLRFTGLRNWRSVLTDADFGHSLLVTGALALLVVPAQTVLGFAAAALVVRRRAGGVFKVLFAL
ncbi:MAG: sugar ABC transporter permease, partial [Nocardia sp.]|nr:sugar ABC transporter permease [Nocardia sp.]